ncbi:MAG: flagellar basal-body rod protein FlgG [Myxococcales bacterium]|nr:flagellar basal-body rod protein FlgG [Myxococcales bacterium]
MFRSLYTAATGMHAQETRMSVIANNLANQGTVGFKKSRPEFEELLSEKIRPAAAPNPTGGTESTALEVGMGVRTRATTRTFSQGSLESTENPMDLAIEGPGFFQVQRPDGEIAYSRAGNFRVDSEGRMVTASGDLVFPQVNLPADTKHVMIHADGRIMVERPNAPEHEEIGQIELALFVNPGGLESIGGNVLVETEASGPPIRTQPTTDEAGGIIQGFLESSNVEAITEMIGMISAQRAYEMNSKVIQSADQMLQKLGNMR